MTFTFRHDARTRMGIQDLVVLVFLLCAVLLGCDKSGGDGEDDATGGDSVEQVTDDEKVAPVETDEAGSDEEGSDGTIGDRDSDSPSCVTLFGRPSANTGLTQEQCRPVCDCGGVDFEAPVYEGHEIAALEAARLLNPPEPLEEDPYGRPDDYSLEPDKVCGVVFDEADPGAYRLETFESEGAAAAAGARVTHTGACGLCSSLANLTVYIKNTDLAGPVRRCGLESTLGGEKKNIECLEKIGFDYPCAQIWYYNTKHTREACLAPCLAALNKPYHKKDGSLNACIQCDEDESGQVFKAVSGRTRRNSGLPSALCRPCDSVAPIVHRY